MTPTTTIAGIILIGVGLLLCFYGYAVFRIALIIVGAIVGYQLGVQLIAEAEVNSALLRLFAAIVGAIIGLLLAFPLWSIGALIYGALFGFSVGTFLGQSLGLDQTGTLIVAIIAAIIFGILIFNFRRLIVMASTAFAGAAAIITGVGYFIPALASGVDANYISLIAWLVLGIIGFAAQTQIFRTRTLAWD